MMIDPIKVLHDFTYHNPEHPVPHAGDTVHLEYAACETSPQATIDVNGDDQAIIHISMPASDLSELIDEARKSVLIDLNLDPNDPDDIARAKADLGEQRFDELVSDTARMYMLSAVLMHARLFPAIGIAPLNREVIKPDRLAVGSEDDATYSFGYQMHILPAGTLTSFDPLEVNLPVQPQVTKMMIDARVIANVRQQLGQPQAQVDPDDSQYAQMREQMRAELEDQFSRIWSNRVVTMCDNALVDRLDESVVIPDSLAKAMSDDLRQEYLSRISDRGITADELLKRPDFDAKKFVEQMDVQASATLRREIALDTMADHLGLMLRAKEILESMDGGDKFPGTGEEHDRAMLAHMMMTGQLPQVCQESRRYKTSDVVARQTLRHIQENAELAMIEEAKKAQAAKQAQADKIAAAGGSPSTSD